MFPTITVPWLSLQCWPGGTIGRVRWQPGGLVKLAELRKRIAVKHLQPYEFRQVLLLPTVELNGWQLKRYGILANDKQYDSDVVLSALHSAIERLPSAGTLDDPDGNHGVGFQIIHFAEIAIVSPVFYWIWGSVLANTDQMRAPWDASKAFETGVKEVVGCIWEMEVVCFETASWKNTMLRGIGTPSENLARYISSSLPSAKPAT